MLKTIVFLASLAALTSAATAGTIDIRQDNGGKLIDFLMRMEDYRDGKSGFLGSAIRPARSSWRFPTSASVRMLRSASMQQALNIRMLREKAPNC